MPARCPAVQPPLVAELQVVETDEFPFPTAVLREEDGIYTLVYDRKADARLVANLAALACARVNAVFRQQLEERE